MLPHRSRFRSARASSSASSASSSKSHASSQEAPLVARPGHSSGHHAPLPPIDEHFIPSLAAKATSAQQTQLYVNWLMSAFPCYFKVTETRVSVNWVQYVSQRRVGIDTPFDWAIRSLTTNYIGNLYNDKRYSDAGHELYVRSLRGLSGLLNQVSAAKSDEALATAIALAVFEMHTCTTADGWMQHASGIRALMQLRGPRAHLHGFGRALYIAYRNTLVTSALVAGEKCLLEKPEWQELNQEIAADNAKQPDSSVYTDITERAFREVVKLPGYVKRLHDLSGATPNVQKQDRPALLHEVLAARASLRGIHTEFSMTASTLRAGQEAQAGFIGPMPYHFFEGFASLSIHGIRSGVLLLNYLIILLDPFQRPAAEAENRLITDRMRTTEVSQSHASSHIAPSPLTPPGSPGRSRLMIESRIGPDTREPMTTDWMDRIATTMGLEGVRVRLVDDG
ncbi:hypothetical protein NUU61_008380 [Penicillium alfredii]|uniref:Uncharacterized protein n=1 Tax=Penicillium alfredii TaxID=1506179 RepID=A0A9W9JZ71_9EURO|nr:uncharacterized protein NUU61_008380 [Penicillium alfredii]KAJ5087073.1 hypothetical protein NUU61_008380 [Penicillium alfredii]